MSCSESQPAVDALAAALGRPVKVSTDAGEVEMPSLSELIAAEKYMGSKCAAKSKRMGLRFTRLIPDGTVGSDRTYG